jgi:hypothetical protein
MPVCQWGAQKYKYRVVFQAGESRLETATLQLQWPAIRRMRYSAEIIANHRAEIVRASIICQWVASWRISLRGNIILPSSSSRAQLRDARRRGTVHRQHPRYSPAQRRERDSTAGLWHRTRQLIRRRRDRGFSDYTSWIVSSQRTFQNRYCLPLHRNYIDRISPPIETVYEVHK